MRRWQHHSFSADSPDLTGVYHMLTDYLTATFNTEPNERMTIQAALRNFSFVAD